MMNACIEKYWITYSLDIMKYYDHIILVLFQIDIEYIKYINISIVLNRVDL